MLPREVRSVTSLPPRRALPRDVQIPPLPGLGVTWYDRGSAYWARRAKLTLMWGFSLIAIGLIDLGFYSAVRQSSRGGSLVLLFIDALLTVGVLVFVAVRTRRRWDIASLPGGAKTVFRVGRGRPGTFLSVFVQIVYWLLVLLTAFLCLLFPAFFIAMFLTSLLPEPLVERQARLWMTEQVRERRLAMPAG